MQKLQLLSQVIAAFLNGNVWRSESGILFELSKEEQEMVNKFEVEHDATVYHVIRSNTNVGLLYDLLYVNHDSDEWSLDQRDVKERHVLSYCINCDDPFCSKLGYIAVKPVFGGLMRVW